MIQNDDEWEVFDQVYHVVEVSLIDINLQHMQLLIEVLLEHLISERLLEQSKESIIEVLIGSRLIE